MSAVPELPAETDTVIVGGGVIGTSIAYFLVTETDRDVTLVEKDSIAAGSTGDSSAIIRHHYGEKEHYTRMALWSHEFYRRFEELVGEPIAYEECPRVVFAEEGSDDAAYADAGYDILSRLDVPTERYEGETLEAEFPMLSLDEFDFAVSDLTAAYSDGTDVASGFARAAAEEGATVVTGTEVTDVAIDEGEVTAVKTDDGTAACEELVLAAGPWTPQLAEMLGIDVPVTPSRERVILLDPDEEFHDKYPESVPIAGLPGGYYIRPEFGDSVLMATHHSGEKVDPDRYQNAPDQSTLLELHETVAEYVPDLDDAGVQGRYSGVYSNSPDHDFILDGCGPDGCYVACGFSGHGFKQAPAVGRVMTDLLDAGESDLVDLDFFSLSRFETSEAGHGGGIAY
ncbi:FAD-binding oxidoreductase [Haloarchaeobius sp. HME9146]|uniref:NAD(P)/FAD-dependent oxidoreductase n=1 Tax=Haloarchaeobius sp. HME9146 TaxID=2978732 RepID=UPI0021C1C6CD|nr:FAD-dependent oxidoreductase [Haloarchaeobius sp. HME9146]MCT9098091.1 FAD-binding oxidoreductase [Haloarchaeobius sp. HME9146]